MKNHMRTLIVSIVLMISLPVALAHATTTSSTSASVPAAKSGCGMCGMGGSMANCPMMGRASAPKSKTGNSDATTIKGKQQTVKCAVTGAVIGSPSQAASSIVYKGKIYYFCCPSCLPKFKANPGKYAKAAVAYPVPSGYSTAK